MIHHSCFSLVLSSFSRVRLQWIPQEEGTDIISAQGQEEGELPLHLWLPEMLSFLKGSGPAEASSRFPSCLQACLSPWKINSLPQDPGDTVEGSHTELESSLGKLSSLPGGGDLVLLGVEDPGLMILESRDMVSTLLDVGLSIISS